MAQKSVKLFYDVISPYSWVAFEVLTRYRTKWNYELIFKPFFLGGIMNASGNKPPMMVPNKAKYMSKDLQRIRDHYKVPLNEITDPFNTLVTKGSLPAMRFLTAVQMIAPEFTENVSRELWMRIWNRDEDITLPESILQAAIKAGMNQEAANEALAKIKDQQVKDKLIETTNEAMEFDAFGAPTMITNVNNKEEMIFGSDRFPILADILGEKYEGPLTELAKSKL